MVICRGYLACSETKIGGSIMTPNVVYAEGDRSLYKSTAMANYIISCNALASCRYSNITASSITCAGYYSCAQSNIDSSGWIMIRGEYGAYNSNITGKIVKAMSSNGMRDSNIIQRSDETLTVYLYGYNAGYNTNIYCLEDLDCTIECALNLACVETRIYYSNLSYVHIEPSTCYDNAGSINNDSIYCPYLIEL